MCLQNYNYSRGTGGPCSKSEWLPGGRDPLEVLMKSVTLASQLYVSIHNPSPKNLTREPPTTPIGAAACAGLGPAPIHVALLCHTLNLKGICSLIFARVVRGNSLETRTVPVPHPRLQPLIPSCVCQQRWTLFLFFFFFLEPTRMR